MTISMEEFHVREMGQSRKREIAEKGVIHVINDIVKGNTEQLMTRICIIRSEEIN